MIVEMILKNCRRLSNLIVCWIDYKKTYDMVPHSWIKQCMGWFGVANNIRRTLEKSMKTRRVELTSGGKTLGDAKIGRGIFQGDSLSLLLFVLALMTITVVLNITRTGYQHGKDRGRINHLLFMDDLKLYAKNVAELDSLVQTVRVNSEDTGMEFGIQKCATVEIRRGRMVGRMMDDKMKDIIRKEYYRRVRKICSSKLNDENTISAVRYGVGVLNWTKEELRVIDMKTRKIMTMNRMYHTQGDTDRLYISRKKGGRGFLSIVECVEIFGLEI